ncbi:TPA: thiosulfate sulfurtransferase PspE [Salmonella enterica subsp. enterica serovar Braenderup]
MLKKGIFALALFIAMPLYAAEYWIDVRIPEQYQREHIQGAINIPLKEIKSHIETVTEAREQGFGLMLGCMLCTSRAISAALPLMPQVSFADLDGPTWLAVDVEPALRFTTGQLHL